MENLNENGQTILELLSRKYGENLRTEFVCLRWGTSSRVLWIRNEPSDSIKGEKFLDQLSDCQLHKNDSAPCGWLLKMK